VQVVEEQEDKFDVDADWVLPPIADLVPDGGRLDQDVRRLENTYFDTPGAGLRLFGVTLRRRVGGSETGWQLKVPNGTARNELQSGSRAKKLPAALADGVRGLRAGESLVQVATIVTTRTAYRILDAHDQLVMEIADDQVESGLPDGESMLHSWREMEVELGPAGKQKDLKRHESCSSLQVRIPVPCGPNWTGPLARFAPDGEEYCHSRRRGEVGTHSVNGRRVSGDSVRCTRQQRRRTAHRRAVIHKTRVAARRMRSTLRVFGDVFGEQPAQELNNELVWYAELLGQVRDCEVLSKRLVQHISDLPSRAASWTCRGRDHARLSAAERD
jgi:inorganic triphosphatase YgiF